MKRVIKHTRSGLIYNAAAYAGKKVGSMIRKAVKQSNRKSKRSKRRSYSSSSSTQPETGGDGSTSFSKFNSKLKPSKFVKGLAATTNKNIYSYSSAGVVFQNTSGLQTASVVGVSNNGIDLRAISQVIVPTSDAGYKTNQIMIRNCSVETLFTNQGPTSVRLWLYDIVPRRDVSNGISGFDPVNCWATGITDSTNGETDTYTWYGSKPKDSPLFRQYYKVVKSKCIIIPAAGHHVHKVYIDCKRLMNYEVFRDLNYLKNLTYLTLVVAHGMPLNDKTTTTNVAVAPCKLDYVTSVRYAYQGLSKNSFYASMTNGQQTITTPQLKTDEVTADFTFA